MKVLSTIWKALCICYIGASLAAAAQEATPAAPASQSAITTQSDHRIALDVVVTDRAGNPVSGLTEQDFALLDNKQPQKLLSFRAVNKSTPAPPTEVILLVDAVNARFITISYERDQIQKFLAQNGGKLAQPVSMIFFTDEKTQVQTAPTLDGKAALAAFDKNVTGLRSITRSQGFYGAEDRLELSIRTLDSLARHEATKPGRKLLVWVSPGWPILSGPRVQVSNKSLQSIFNTIVSLSTLLRQARITLYSVDPLGTGDAGTIRLNYYEEFLKGVTKPNNAQPGNLALQVLATQSGGLVLNSSNDLTSLIVRATQDADVYYELTYDPPPADGPNDYRNLTVNVDKPGLKARTRTGYYAQP